MDKDIAPNGSTLAAFERLPLTVRMRAAAVVVDDASGEFNARNGLVKAHWHADHLLDYANRWDREDAEKSHRDTEVEELAQVIRSTTGRLGSWDSIMESAREEYREQARAVLGAGYRKQATDE